jgi:hypothetical protein
MEMLLFKMESDPTEEFYLVEGEKFQCDQIVRRSGGNISMVDMVLKDLTWYGTDKEFFEALRLKNRSERDLIEIDFEGYFDFFAETFGIEIHEFRIN